MEKFIFDTPDIPKVLGEIKRVLKPTGRLGVVSIPKEDHEDSHNRLCSIGREKVMIEGIPAPGAYIFYLTTKFRKGFYASLANEIVSKMARGKVLDIGTGSGDVPIEIAKRADNLEIIGTDLSKALIKIARKTAKREGVEGKGRSRNA